MRNDDNPRFYRTFEEFEREELRRSDAMGASIGDMLDDVLMDELDFDAETVRRSAARDLDDEE